MSVGGALRIATLLTSPSLANAGRHLAGRPQNSCKTGVCTMKRSFLALTAALVSFACTESPTASEISPQFNFSNGPSNPGPLILRFDVLPASIIFPDFERQLVAVLSTGDGLLGCRDVTSSSPLTVQELVNPNGVVQVLTQLNGFVAVYDLPGFETTCSVLINDALAFGSVRVLETDNDANVSGTRTNAFRFKANGTLDNLVGDGTIAFNLHFNSLIKKDGSFKSLQEDIRISPDPR